MNESLVSVPELKVYIQVEEGNTEFDAQLLGMAKTATKLLETWCRREFAKKEYTEIFTTRQSGGFVYNLWGGAFDDDGLIEQPGVQRFNLKGPPIDTDEAITIAYSPSRMYDTGQIVTSSQYFLDADKGTLLLFLSTAAVSKALKITYTGGYDTEEDTLGSGGDTVTYDLISGAPDDLKMAAITQTMFLFNKIRESSIGVVGSSGRNSPVYSQNELLLCPEAIALATPYRKVLLGRK